MSVSKDILLNKLPAYKDEWVTVTRTQDVKDIMKDIIKCHKEFRRYYDAICSDFIQPTIEQTADELYNFCVTNIHYREENEDLQTTALPTGILYRGHGDCKHYASFIGGVLGGLQRMGENIDWYYCFASYKVEQRTPYHVFVVVVKDDCSLLYIDPTPGAENKQPVWVVNERVSENTNKVAGLYVDNIGQLSGVLPAPAPPSVQNLYDSNQVTQQATPGIGTIEAGTVPLPDNYPFYLPRPYITKGRLQLTPVPPNLVLTDLDLAYVLIALQAWIFTYSKTPYNILKVSGGAMIEQVRDFVRYFRNPDSYKNGFYGYYQTVYANKSHPTYTEFVPYDFSNLTGLKSRPYSLVGGAASENKNFLIPKPEGSFEGWAAWGAPLIIAGVKAVISAVAVALPIAGVFAGYMAKVQATEAAVNQLTIDNVNKIANALQISEAENLKKKKRHNLIC